MTYVAYVHYPHCDGQSSVHAINLEDNIKCTNDVLREDASSAFMALSSTYPNPFLEATLIILVKIHQSVEDTPLNISLHAYNSRYPITTQLNEIAKYIDDDAYNSINYANNTLVDIIKSLVTRHSVLLSTMNTKLHLSYVPQYVDWTAAGLCVDCKYAPATSSNVDYKYCYTCALVTKGVSQGKSKYSANPSTTYTLDMKRSEDDLFRINSLHKLVQENDPHLVIMNGSTPIGYSEELPHPTIFDDNISRDDMIFRTTNALQFIASDGDWYWGFQVNRNESSVGFMRCDFCQGRYDAVVWAYPCLHPQACLYCYINKLTQQTDILICTECHQPFSWLMYLHKYNFIEERTAIKVITYEDINCLNKTLFPHFPLRRHAGEDPANCIISTPNTHNAWGWLRVLSMLKWLNNPMYQFPFDPILEFEGGDEKYVPLKIRLPLPLVESKCCLYDRLNKLAYLPILETEKDKFCVVKGSLLNVCKILAAYNTCLLKCSLFSKDIRLKDPMGLPYETYIEIPQLAHSVSIVNTLRYAAMSDVNAAVVSIQHIISKLYNIPLDVESLRAFVAFKGYIFEFFTAIIAQHTYSLAVSKIKEIEDVGCLDYDGTYTERMIEKLPTHLMDIRDRIDAFDDQGRCIMSQDNDTLEDIYTTRKSIGLYLQDYLPKHKKVIESTPGVLHINGVLTVTLHSSGSNTVVGSTWATSSVKHWAMIFSHYILYAPKVSPSTSYIDMCTSNAMRITHSTLSTVERALFYTLIE